MTVQRRLDSGYGAAMPSNASIEHFPALLMYSSRKPPIVQVLPSMLELRRPW
jgi:hypothetical protein